MSQRQAFTDQLRGLALLGIILVNVPYLAISGSGYTEASLATSWDAIVAFLVTMLAAGKFYVIFSFLFGYSALFILKDGSPLNRRVYRRRLIALLVLGIAHVVLLFVGDILVTYALLGFALLLLFRRSDRALWVTALIAWAIAACWVVGLAALLALVSALFPEAEVGELAVVAGYDAAMADGTFVQGAVERLLLYPATLLGVLLGQGILAFGLFCLGMLAARHRLLDRLEDFRPWYRRAAIWGLSIGLPVQFACTWIMLGPGRGDALGAAAAGEIAFAVQIVVGPVLSAGYVGALALLTLRRPRALAVFTLPGRASLTIYLGESTLLCFIFCGWGLGLFGTLGAASVTAIAIGCWAVLALAMSLWLHRFRQGPFEAAVAVWTKAPLRKPVALQGPMQT